MLKLAAVPPLQSHIELPDYVSAACSDALACYCTQRGITEKAQIFELTALVEEAAQRIHLAQIQHNQF
ncbi:hypothetical protein [Pseudoduganella sp. R-34]|uniref:hypothetical protein n=1 Tax=Pseudoduganella sp. R-34 TaxID=3404062 RepID=UPI003CF3D198